jgi:hypothetical protein
MVQDTKMNDDAPSSITLKINKALYYAYLLYPVCPNQENML